MCHFLRLDETSSASHHAREPVNNLRVLVLEDDPDLLESIRELLEDDGHVVTRATSLAEATSSLGQSVHDVALLDHGLPEGDSQTILDGLVLRQDSPSIILCSATPALVSLAQRYQVYFLAKPFDIDALMQLVRRAACEPRRPSLSGGE